MQHSSGYTVESVLPDIFRLDGGAMFGAVPKALWERRIPSDERNRIQLACRILHLTGYGKEILIDLGCGTKWNDKDRDIFAVEPKTKPVHELFPGTTDVILTHLHFDHAGGISYNSPGLMLSFPRAAHYLPKKNLEHARNPGPRERASYLRENIEVLDHAKLNLTTNGSTILPFITAFEVNGHTHGLQWLLIGQAPGAIAYPADLIPTAHHVSIPYVMGYDLCAETTMREKHAFLERAVQENWIVVFEHDIDTPAATIRKDEKGQFTVDKVAQL